MKKVLNILTLVSLLFYISNLAVASPVATASAQTLTQPSFMPGQVIAKFKVGYSPTADFLKKYSLASADKILGQFKFNSKLQSAITSIGLDRTYVLLTKNTSADIISLVQSIKSEIYIEYSEPNYIYRLQSDPSDSLLGNQWALKSGVTYWGQVTQTGYSPDVRFLDVWNSGFGPNNAYNSIEVGLIDSGVDKTHPDLAGNMLSGINLVGSNTLATGNTDTSDVNGHGTQMAGVIGALANNGKGIAGVNWRAKIVPIKAFSSNDVWSGPDGGNIVDITEAIAYAGNKNIKVVNLSWGSRDYSNTLLQMMQAVLIANPNTLFIAAAGNGFGIVNNGVDNNNDLTPFYPASYPLNSIISVAATDQRDQLTAFSNYGPTSVDIGAAGIGIETTNIMSSCSDVLNGCYINNGTGTSYSAAYVSGAISLYWSQPNYVNQSAIDVKNVLLNYSDKNQNLLGKFLSGGRLDIYTMLINPTIPPLTPRI